MQLYLPKKNLNSILKNHMASTKHVQGMEDSKNVDRRADVLLSRRKGRPWITSVVSVESNQQNLWRFYRKVSAYGKEGESLI